MKKLTLTVVLIFGMAMLASFLTTVDLVNGAGGTFGFPFKYIHSDDPSLLNPSIVLLGEEVICKIQCEQDSDCTNDRPYLSIISITCEEYVCFTTSSGKDVMGTRCKAGKIPIMEPIEDISIPTLSIDEALNK